MTCLVFKSYRMYRTPVQHSKESQDDDKIHLTHEFPYPSLVFFDLKTLKVVDQIYGGCQLLKIEADGTTIRYLS